MDSRPKSEEFPPANWVPESKLMTLSIQTTSKEKYQHQFLVGGFNCLEKNTTVKLVSSPFETTYTTLPPINIPKWKKWYPFFRSGKNLSF